MELMQASRQWSSRPADERCTSLFELGAKASHERKSSKSAVVSSHGFSAEPAKDNKGLVIRSNAGHEYAPTHWAFGQVAELAHAPAGYLRSLPSPIAADCINYGLKFKRSVEDVGLLLYKNGESLLRAATGPNYGRIWNSEVADVLIDRFGDGVSGDWRVPGEFGKRVEVTKENTTLYMGDRDMFVFLADEDHRVEISNRRNGQAGELARGFFVWNSEVGSSTFGIASFLFDYVCCNRIVWGATEFKQLKMRHTVSAPDRFFNEIAPALEVMRNSSTRNIVSAIDTARAAKIDGDVDEFLAKRFGKRLVEPLKAVHALEEDHPIETIWDAATAVTAYAKSIKWQDARVAMEREGGKLLELVAA